MYTYTLLVLVAASSLGCLAHIIQSPRACANLTAILGSDIVQSPSGTQFDAGAHSAFNLFTQVLTPTCVVFPRDASHVQTAMTAIYNFRAHYAVQAGSHSGMTGWNNVDGGVLINFMNMTNISFDPVSDTISLEPGVHWEDAVAALQAQGVAPVGGRQGDVGTGLLLGGGLSFLSPSNGFAADNFKSLDVVLVNGTLVTATVDNEHSDLFRALKGGGSRFGIVTKYDLIPVHTGTQADKTYFGGSIRYPASSIDALINATARYVANVTDPNAVLLVTVVGVNTQFGLITLGVVELFYNGTSLPTDIFGDFLSIPTISQNLGPLSYVDVSTTIAATEVRGFGQEFGGSSLLGDENLFINAHKSWANFTQTFISELTLSVLAITPVSTTQIQIGRDRGGNIINPPMTNFAYFLFGQQFLPNVTTAPADLEAGKLLLFEQVPRSHGLPLFLNEVDKRQNVFATYGSFSELNQTYFKYDPTGFNVDHTDGPIGIKE